MNKVTDFKTFSTTPMPKFGHNCTCFTSSGGLGSVTNRHWVCASCHCYHTLPYTGGDIILGSRLIQQTSKRNFLRDFLRDFLGKLIFGVAQKHYQNHRQKKTENSKIAYSLCMNMQNKHFSQKTVFWAFQMILSIFDFLTLIADIHANYLIFLI